MKRKKQLLNILCLWAEEIILLMSEYMKVTSSF